MTRRPQEGRAPAGAAELLPLTVPEVRRLLWGVVWGRRPRPEVSLRWSWWRRRHQARAKRCHYQQRHARAQP